MLLSDFKIQLKYLQLLTGKSTGYLRELVLEINSQAVQDSLENVCLKSLCFMQMKIRILEGNPLYSDFKSRMIYINFFFYFLFPHTHTHTHTHTLNTLLITRYLELLLCALVHLL